MDPTNPAIAQLLAMSQQPQRQQIPQAVPPNRMASGTGAPVADPMQGFGQLAQNAAMAMGRGNSPSNGFPQAPLNTAAMGMDPGGLFGMLRNPMANYSKGGGLY